MPLLSFPTDRQWMWVGLLAIAALGTVVYWSSLHGTFFFDDEFNILNNAGIRQWADWHELLFAEPENFGVAGHPVLNLLYALNYWAGGFSPSGYHAVNLAIHLLTALVLRSVLWRTLALPSMPERIRRGAQPLALLIVLVWLVHPLQTNAVTYISQRAEELVALFYLLALYGLIRLAAEANRWRWAVLAIAGGFLGMQVKENIATVPVFLLVYDRVFLAGSWRAAGRQRWRFYLGMACIWLQLPNVKFNQRGYGFGLGVDPWHYLLTESHTLCRYLAVIFWPPLMVFDYGHHFARSLGDVWPWAALVAAGLAATGWAWRRDPRLGFAGVAFLLLLAPTTSIIPFNEMPYAESRLYLPLAVVLTAVLVAAWAICRGWTALIALGVIPLFAHATIMRNREFVDEVALYRADLLRVPGNARILSNLGKVYLARGRTAEAETALLRATQLDPSFSMAFNNLGTAYQREGRLAEAIDAYYRARRLDPYDTMTRENLADLLARQQDWSRAAGEYRQLLLLSPGDAKYECNLGDCYQHLGRLDDALECYRTALELDDSLIDAHNDLGSVYLLTQRYPEAIATLRDTLRRDPGFAAAYFNLGAALAATGQNQAALQAYATGLRLNPNSSQAIQALQELVKKLSPPGERPQPP